MKTVNVEEATRKLQDPTTPANQFESLSRSRNAEIRARAALITKSPQILVRLVRDRSWKVAEEAVLNLSTPNEALSNVPLKDNEYVRWDLESRRRMTESGPKSDLML